MKQPEYNYYQGKLDEEIVSSLNRTLSQYKRYWIYVKVGITANPERRWSEYDYRCDLYQRMVVVYKTNSINKANKLEKWFIENRWDDLENIWKGRSNMTQRGPYFVYFVMRKKE